MEQDKQFIPVRIQRSRKHKQVSPNLLEVKYVGRPGKFGNPYISGGSANLTNEEAVNLFKQYVEKWQMQDEIKSELKGKNLSCWFKIGDYCHADFLLEIANS